MQPEAKKQKILYVITKSNWGGAQRYVFDMATGMKDKADVKVVVGGSGLLKEKLEAAGIEVISLTELGRDVNILKDFKVLGALISLFKKEQPDVIHLNSSKIGIMGALAGRMSGVPHIIFTGHGWAFNENRSSIQKTVFYFLHWLTVVLAHKTIAVSKTTRDQIAFLPFISKKITVIYNGIETPDFLSKEEARAFFQTCHPTIKKDVTWIGTISELHPTKGLAYAIQACAELKAQNVPFQFIIIGEGHQRPVLEAFIAEKNLTDTVILAGYVPNAAHYLKAFDIMTLTSITEALPYAVAETGMAGLPMLASAVGGIPEFIEQMKSGILVQRTNVKEIREGLLYLINNPERSAQFASVLHQNIITTFTKEKMLAETSALYLQK